MVPEPCFGEQLARRLFNQNIGSQPMGSRLALCEKGLVQDAHGIRWVTDITVAGTVQVIIKLLFVWDLVCTVTLTLKPDMFIWKRLPDGQYSSASAYSTLFVGHVDILGDRWIWKVQMPRKYKFFAWLDLHGLCWTLERLRRHGFAGFRCLCVMRTRG